MNYSDRIDALREDMKKNGIDFFLTVSSDDHASEYICDHYKFTEYLTGCTSDNVILIVTGDEALLWTDGRYFISAAGELVGSGVKLMKSGEPGVESVSDFLKSHLKEGSRLGFNGMIINSSRAADYERIAGEKKAEVVYDYAPEESVWLNRPDLPVHSLFILPDDITGESYEKKKERLLEKLDGDYIIISKLDDIMWLLNVRGNDIAYNPVALSYMIFGKERQILFIRKEEVTEELSSYLDENGVTLAGYDEIISYIKSLKDCKVMIDPDETSDLVMKTVEKSVGTDRVIKKADPIELMKAVKNDVELDHIRKTYIMDSVAVCRFIFRMKRDVGRVDMTELDAAEILDKMRSELPGYIELSFETIPAYNENAAMAHYAPDKASASRLQKSGFLLVDSGATYMGGTTDVTRTIVLGKLTDQEKADFTSVAVSNLRLLYAKFPKGTSGVGLDAIARQPLWDREIDFNHGTGHGIGYMLNVHEGPQSIRRRNADTPFVPGMITSDEPGIYRENMYGIRTESITECVEVSSGEFGTFLGFRPLTFVPIDLDAIDGNYMTKRDIELLNDYHKKVRNVISPYLKGEELDWLISSTEPVK